MANIKIEVRVEGVGDPKIPIYEIKVWDEEGEKGVWNETYGSEELAQAFLKGLEAAFSLTEVGFVERPTIPTLRGF